MGHLPILTWMIKNYNRNTFTFFKFSNFTASFSGENLENFTDLDGKECSFQEYLKSHGLFFSQYHLYIRTKLKESDKEMHTATEDCDKTESVFLVNNENPGDIKLTFKKTKISRYSGSPSTI